MSQAKSRLAEAIGSYQKVIHQAQSDIAQAQLRFQEGQRGYQSLLQAGKLAVFKNQEQINNLETQLATLKSDIAQSQSQIAALKFQLAQRVIRAPISGTIFHLPISKPGAVLKPGEMVTQIAPQGTPLVIKANMPSPESGFIQVGLPVKIKFDAYPFQDYGIVSGSLTWVSPDSKPQDTPQGKIDTFDLEITLDRPYIDSGSKRIALTAGQTATAEVIVRQRRVIDFVLDPFKKLQKGGLKL
jgi:HlyD family secretion protein